MRDQKLLLEDILESIGIIESQVKGADKSKFMGDIPFQDAIIRRLSVIGEAAKNVSKELKEKHKNINWKGIIGMRNLIVHEYFEMDLDLVWEAVERDIPILKRAINEMMKELK